MLKFLLPLHATSRGQTGSAGPWMDQDWIETGPRLDWDWNKTIPRLDRDWIETGSQQDQDLTETARRLDRDWSETGPRLDQDWTKTKCPSSGRQQYRMSGSSFSLTQLQIIPWTGPSDCLEACQLLPWLCQVSGGSSRPQSCRQFFLAVIRICRSSYLSLTVTLQGANLSLGDTQADQDCVTLC